MTTPPSPEPPMDREPPAGLEIETDPRFPSGPWTGFFLMDHWPGRHQMELRLTFGEGNLNGEGRDRIGEFLVRGQYNLENGKCHWSKRYIGKHDVFYQGYNEGKGIWGLWEIPPGSRGGFHIWPEGMGDPTSPQLAESAETPAEPPAEVEAPVEVGAGVGAGVGEGLAEPEPEPVGSSRAAGR